MRLGRAGRPRSSAVLLAAGGLLTGGLVLGATGAAYAVDGDDCTSINEVDAGEGEVTTFGGDGSPVRALQVAAAQARVARVAGRPPGDGVTVAVLDSGVRPDLPGLRVVRGEPAPGASRTQDLVWHQGTLMAGVIAGAPDAANGVPIGIAPGARVYDQRVYDSAVAADGLTTLGPGAVAAGLEAIAPLIGKDGIRLVTVAVVSQDSARLRAAVDRVTDKGAVIIAAAAPRTLPGAESPLEIYQDGEDLNDRSYPAGYAKDSRDAPANPRVVAVATTGASGDVALPEFELTDHLLLSSAIDVAAPSAGAVSWGINGRYCSIQDPSNAVAAAEVAGVLALLMTAYPKDTPEQLIARLEATAAGSSGLDPATPDTRAGNGVVQPLEALARPLAPRRDGVLPRSFLPGVQSAPAAVPVPDPDVLASTREHAVWWGLFGGGVLVVLMLLRPVVARRR